MMTPRIYNALEILKAFGFKNPYVTFQPLTGLRCFCVDNVGIISCLVEGENLNFYDVSLEGVRDKDNIIASINLDSRYTSVYLEEQAKIINGKLYIDAASKLSVRVSKKVDPLFYVYQETNNNHGGFHPLLTMEERSAGMFLHQNVKHLKDYFRRFHNRDIVEIPA